MRSILGIGGMYINSKASPSPEFYAKGIVNVLRACVSDNMILRLGAEEVDKINAKKVPNDVKKKEYDAFRLV